MTVPEMLEKKLVLEIESKRNFSSIETNYQSEKVAVHEMFHQFRNFKLK